MREFVDAALISELLRSERIAGSIFLRQIKTHCKLQEHLDLLHKVFFMKAGYHMQQFAVDLFEKLDQGLRVDNLVLLNSHFHESIEDVAKKQFTSQELQRKLSVEFADNPEKYRLDSVNSLDYIAIDFRVSIDCASILASC